MKSLETWSTLLVERLFGSVAFCCRLGMGEAGGEECPKYASYETKDQEQDLNLGMTKYGVRNVL